MRIRGMVAGLLVLAGPITMAEDAPQLWGIGVCQDGEVLPSMALPSAAALPCELAHLWVWDLHRAFRRIDGDDAGPLLKRTDPERGLPDPFLNLQIVGGSSFDQESKGRWFEVIAAPVEGWLEIPESYLPRWSVDSTGLARVPIPDEGLRIRVVGQDSAGQGSGSWWREIPGDHRRSTVAVFAAEDRRINVVGPEGSGVPGLTAKMVSQRAQRTAEPELARFLSDKDGVLSLVSIPDAAPVFFEIAAPELAPTVRFGLPSALPSSLRLERGAQIRGRVLRKEGAPLPKATISFEAWIDPRVPRPLSRQTISADDGAWSLKGLPEGRGLLEISAAGYSTFREEVSIDASETLLGDQVLSLPGRLAVRVLGVKEEPVVDAMVLENGDVLGRTDKEGVAVLVDRSSEQGLRLRVMKPGYVPQEVSLAAPLPGDFLVVLERAAEVRGCLVLGEDTPVEADIEVRRGAETSKASSDGSGCFRLEVGGVEEVELHIWPRQGAIVTIPVTAPGPGQVLDLGQITVDAGFSLRGVALRGADSVPVSGARVWAVRSGARGPVVAWMMGHLMETETDQDGRFELLGLDGGEAVIHLEASGLARASKTVIPSPPGASSAEDLTFFLDEGSSLTAALEGDAEGEEVLLIDLHGRGLPEGFVRSWFDDGLARVDHLPTGRHRYRVARGEERLCEGDVAVPESGVALEVQCTMSNLMLSGQVLLGEHPAEGGHLRWMKGESPHAEAIMNFVGKGGLRQNRSFSWGAEQILVHLDEGGEFETSRLRPGRWQVYWEKGEQRSAGLTQELAEGSEGPLTLRFVGGLLRGSVTTANGEAIPRAQVRDRENEIAVITDPEGEFVVPGLSAGTHVLQAKKGGLESEWVEIEVVAGEDPRSVTLTLDAAEQNAVEVTVLSQRGEPVRGGFVYFEAPGMGLRLRSLNANGIARLELPRPAPDRLRIAAFSGGDWVFGPWEPFVPEDWAIDLRLSPTGTLQVQSDSALAPLGLSAPGDWDLGVLLRRLGRAPVFDPSGEWMMTGLPRGRYRVEVDSQVEEVEIRPGSVEQLEIGGG